MPRAEYAERRVWTGWADAGAGGRQGWRGRAGSQVSGGVADLRPATRAPAQNLRPATHDPVRPGPCPGHSGAPRGARHSHTMHSTPCTNYVRKQYTIHKLC